jgi:hypothetical protein
MDAGLVLVVEAMKRAFYWVFVLHTVCGACSGSVTCFANLTRSNLTLDSIHTGVTRASEIVLDSNNDTESIEIPDTKGLSYVIPPNGARLMQFNCLNPKFRLVVDGKTFTNPDLCCHDVWAQIFGDFVVTEIGLVPVVISEEWDQFPSEVGKHLRKAESAFIVEPKENAGMLDLVARHPCYYSRLRVQRAQENLLKRSRSKVTRIEPKRGIEGTDKDRFWRKSISKGSKCQVS